MYFYDNQTEYFGENQQSESINKNIKTDLGRN